MSTASTACRDLLAGRGAFAEPARLRGRSASVSARRTGRLVPASERYLGRSYSVLDARASGFSSIFAEEERLDEDFFAADAGFFAAPAFFVDGGMAIPGSTALWEDFFALGEADFFFVPSLPPSKKSS